ncbi:exported alkaline phosphatase [Paenibacillus baekrokdamisoli]|uniref:Exported alkaline phosphatase n=1 Tax=Paenibacillus baekrokdamisoli TaxID=1712516 RepID=A0A3G9J4B6_9BACL|nr:alkaline phosphatase PhoX [Paenibacillus baekrokdamisoli]MBB3072315.1 hypothetical protein [Paenibacillus baekrokdamisoli]BBH23185.1 exported alkaline phosphatase [Paenibacillus baekrokdamisoli]
MKLRKRISARWIAPVLGLALVIPSVLPVPVSAASLKASVQSVEFVGMPAPATTQDMAKIYSSASLKVTYSDNSVKLFPLSYTTMFKTTDSIGGTIAGVSVDAKGKPILDTSVPNDPKPFVSDGPDANSLFQVQGAAATGLGGNPLSMVTHYEYITTNNAGKSAYGLIPASMSYTTIDQNKTTGELHPVTLSKIDFSSVDGLWIPCNGSLSPWNTHLGSEEYEPDARAFEADPKQTYVNPFVQSYYQDPTKVGNPYSYNYIVEVTAHPDNSTSVVKHYSMGRFSHELSKVAPDQKTVYFGDDGGNTMLFMYVADQAKNLSAGTLYAGKWIQKSADNGGSADLQWFKLGHATDNEVKSYIDKGVKFSDLFQSSEKAADGYTAIKSYPTGKVEYLKVKSGMEQAAAFLESRRYGAILGATAEFNKMEGVALNAKDKKLYVAMSYVEKAMEKDTKGTDPSDDIQVNKLSAGVTYEVSLTDGQKDRDGQAINSQYVPTFMKGLVWGEDLSAADSKGNSAAEDKVANPDNLSYSESLRTLFIGEDSGKHVNNFVWAYNTDTKKLSRILTTPAGAEATGLQAVDNLNGFSYIMSNLQHPGDEMIVAESLKPEVEKYINQNFDNKKAGMVGYISGLPSLQQLEQAAPSITPDTTLIPLRETAQAAGAKVVWHGIKKEIVISYHSHTLKVLVGSMIADIDGTMVDLPAQTVLKNGKVVFSASVLHNFLSMN